MNRLKKIINLIFGPIFPMKQCPATFTEDCILVCCCRDDGHLGQHYSFSGDTW